MSSNIAASVDSDLAATDLGPLAWVLDELRKSLDGATKATRRFVRDAELALGQDIASLDASQLRIARQQLHQAVGALEMVGLRVPAHMLRTMESMVQRFVQRPELCSDEAATVLERASFALTEFLEGMVKGKHASTVALFPQYRAVAEMAGVDRVHPADLWSFDWRWVEVADLPMVQDLQYTVATREKLDWAILNIVKSANTAAALRVAELANGLSCGQDRLQPRTFWAIASAYFEAFGAGAIPSNVHTKRAASRVLQQYATLSRGDNAVSDRLAQDLLFFCATAQSLPMERAPRLEAVRAAYGLEQSKPVDYETEQFGRYDPALLQMLRKRIASASETWSTLCGGDTHKLKLAGEQFAAVTDLMAKLHPESRELATALARTAETTVKRAVVPDPAVAMEVATTVLYLDAVYEDLDPTDSELAQRSARLAQRLLQVSSGAAPDPMESWMEELYRRVSDRQTMGSVVAELRGALGEIEKSLDAFFRNPSDKGPLREVPNHLAAMRGVFSVLGLDQPSTAALRMRAKVEQLLIDDIQSASVNPVFEQLGNNLGAMGFLIDMLSYQRELAKKLFVFDEATGELKPLMGREQAPVVAQNLVVSEPAAQLSVEPAPASVQVPSPAPVAVPVAAVPVDDEDDDGELLDIFLDEAREVVQNGLAAIDALGSAPADLGEQTILRRAFHTLKGSSRMVGLTEFGEAAWSFEQIMNSLLAEQRAASDNLLQLTRSAMQAFGRWIEDIAQGTAQDWRAADFRTSADAMRLNAEYLALPGVGADMAAALEVPEAPTVDLVADGPVPLADLGVDLNVDWGGASEVSVASSPEVSSPHLATSIASEIDWNNAELIEVQDLASPSLDNSVPADVAQSPAGTPEVTVPIALDEMTGGNVLTAPDEEFHPDFVSTQTLEIHSDLPAPTAAPSEDLDLGNFDFGNLVAPAPESGAHSNTPVEPLAQEDALDFDAATEPQAAVELPPLDLSFPEPAPESVRVQEIHETLPTEVEPSEADMPRAPGQETTQLAALDDFVSEGAREAFETAMAPTQIAALDVSTPLLSEPEPEPELDALDESVKVIGDLRLSIPLYNVFLNEADEWSRRLQSELSEWALDCEAPVPDMAVVLAHSLQGSSATVGFSALSGLGRALEHALEHVQLHRAGTPAMASVFLEAAEDIRRLLHQFAAGFLKEPTPGLQEALQAITNTEFAPASAEEDPVLQEPSSEATLEDSPLAPEQPVPSAQSADKSAQEMALDNVGGAVAVHAPVAMAAPLTVVEDEDEDLDAVDNLDADLFPIFEEEAQELLPQLAAALRQWMVHPEDMAARNDVLRALHTLKGSARLAGAMRLGEMAHNMETSIEHIGSENLQAQQIEPLQNRLDRIQATFEKLGSTSVVGVESLEALQGDAIGLDASSSAAVTMPTALAAAPSSAASATVQIQPTLRGVQAAGMVAQPRQSNNQTVRVRSRLLDRLVNQAGEVLISRSRMDSRLAQIRSSLEDLGGNLERLRQQLRDVELQSESQMQSRLAQAKDTAQSFDPLEFDRFTRVQELTRMMAESVHDVATVQRNLQREVDGTEDDLIAQGRQARELQRDLLRTRMVEFDSVSERLYGVVRQAAKDTGKQVKLDIVGGSIEMDRGVLERMVPSFEHMLRNAVSHGIEDAALRTAAGKTASGTITVQVDQHSNDVSVSFADDGGGLHLDRIRARALAQGLITAEQELSPADAANLIFTPGFSTAEQVTELSGRGIGMDVVRAEVSALGGRIETTTSDGQGSQFKLVLPLTTAVTQVVMVRMGELTIGIPSNLIETVQRSAESVVSAAYASAEYFFGGENLPFFWAGALLQVSARSTEPAAKTQQVVVLRSAGQRMAVHVDDVLGNREVVVKNLGPQLSRLPGLTGMSVLASGAVVLIYNPVALSNVYGEHARTLSQQLAAASPDSASNDSEATAPQPSAGDSQVPLVLVVDDSITVRRVTQRLLKREGYRVAVASDGLQALERLMEERPAVVLSDIEMPRMDGFDLVRNIRNDARLKGLPVIMITSRIAQKHRDLARELGADHYLGKPYSEEELLALVHRYAMAQGVAAAEPTTL